MAYTEFPLPLQGLSEGLPVASEQGTTSGYMSDVRPRDVLEKRLRIGQRPGLKKTYAQQISGAANPIVWLGSITTATGGLSEVEQDTYKTGDDAQINVDATTDRMGQSFTANQTYYITSVKVKCNRLNNPGNITITLKATDGSGLPTGSVLATATFAQSVVGTTTNWTRFEFASAYQLTSGTKYAFYFACASGGVSNYIGLRRDTSSPSYSGGCLVSSTDSGSTWANATDSDIIFATYGQTAPVAEQQYQQKLVAIGGNQVWYETSLGTTMSVLTDATDNIDTTLLLNAVEAYQKIFIVNRTNLKVVDFVNSKLSTTDAGLNPCTKGMTLTGGTSGATMILDYVDGVTDNSSMNAYGYRTSDFLFVSGETVTGTNSAGSAVSFVLSADEVAPPVFYSWTVFGSSATSYGTMPVSSNLICLYRGRLTINDTNRPQAWYMLKSGDPWKVLYDFTNDGDLSAVTYANNLVGQIGDILTAFIPYKDDLLLFGGTNSIWVLVGDPLSDGQIAEVTHDTGIWGSRAWCIDNAKNLYFLGNDGIYKMPISETSSPPVNISKIKLPALITDLDLDKSLHRVVLSFDPIENGIIISKTLLADGTNTDYFFSLITEGFFPESYPASCGIFSSYYYPATDETYKKFLVGCADGYIREFDPSTKNDTTTSSTSAIGSYCTIIQQISEDEFHNGMLHKFSGIVSGGASSGSFSDTDGVSYELHKGNDAETVLEDIKDGATAFTSGTWSSTGKQNKSRPRMRGAYAGIKLYNSTASQTWSLEKLYGDVIGRGKI